MVVDFDALEAAGIANARGRAGLIDYLDKLGFTADEMVEAERRGRLFGLAGDALQGSGRPIHSLRTAAEVARCASSASLAGLGRDGPDDLRPGGAHAAARPMSTA